MLHELIESIAAVPFFGSIWFGILAMVIVGGSWCLIGFVMGDAPKRNSSRVWFNCSAICSPPQSA